MGYKDIEITYPSKDSIFSTMQFSALFSKLSLDGSRNVVIDC